MNAVVGCASERAVHAWPVESCVHVGMRSGRGVKASLFDCGEKSLKRTYEPECNVIARA